eukprot:14199275-Alexandrium_andersonii.AAC.1
MPLFALPPSARGRRKPERPRESFELGLGRGHVRLPLERGTHLVRCRLELRALAVRDLGLGVVGVLGLAGPVEQEL